MHVCRPWGRKFDALYHHWIDLLKPTRLDSDILIYHYVDIREYLALTRWETRLCYCDRAKRVSNFPSSIVLHLYVRFALFRLLLSRNLLIVFTKLAIPPVYHLLTWPRTNSILHFLPTLHQVVHEFCNAQRVRVLVLLIVVRIITFTM